MKEKYINHCKSRLFKKNIFPANVGHLSIQIKIRVKKCHFCWRYLRFSLKFQAKNIKMFLNFSLRIIWMYFHLMLKNLYNSKSLFNEFSFIKSRI